MPIKIEIETLLHEDIDDVIRSLGAIPLGQAYELIPPLLAKAEGWSEHDSSTDRAVVVRALTSVQMLLARFVKEGKDVEKTQVDSWAVHLLKIVSSTHDADVQRASAQALSVAMHGTGFHAPHVHDRVLRVFQALAQTALSPSMKEFASTVCSNATLAGRAQALHMTIDRHHLGIVEAEPGLACGAPELVLEEVIVVADRVESPNNALRAAVRKNLLRQIRYTFLVSKGHARSEKKRYFRDFETIAAVLASEPGRESIKGLVGISDLPYTWDNYPYVFYRLRAPAFVTVRTIAFRGSDRTSGISSDYYRVAAEDAHTIARNLFEGAARRSGPKQANPVREAAQRLSTDDYEPRDNVRKITSARSPR